jgi:hypothetical protein
MPHTPWMGRHFGIEMEMTTRTTTGGSIGGTRVIASKLTAAGVPNVRFSETWMNSSGGTTWDVKTDSSCGYEVAGPKMMLDADGHNDELRRACGALGEISPQLTTKCGVHVHVDVSDLTWQQVQALIALWLRYEPFFFELLPTSRLDNFFCAPYRGSRWSRAGDLTASQQAVLDATDAQTFTQRGSMAFSTKYRSMNMAPYWHSGRVEFRLHSASIDYDKLRLWTTLLLYLVGRVKAADAPPLSRKVAQPAKVGFRPQHVLKMLGIGDTSWTEANDVSRSVERWVLNRHSAHGARRA